MLDPPLECIAIRRRGRPGRGLRLASAAVAALGGALAGAIAAAAEVRAVRIDYEAHEGCPTAAAFFEEVTSRTKSARAAAEGEAAIEVRVRITRGGGGSRGRIRIADGGDARARQVDGPTCEEVVGALALITALKVDPQASLAPRAPGAAGAAGDDPGSGAAAGAASGAAAGADSASAPASDPASAPAAAPEPAPIPVPVPASAPAPTSAPAPSSAPPRAPSSDADKNTKALRSTIGVHGAAAFGVAPRALLGGGPFVELYLDRGLRPSLRLAAEITTTGAFDVGPGGALFTRSIGRLDACPASLRPTPWLSIGPCLGAEGGVIRAEGRLGDAISDVKQVTVPWASLGALARAAVDAGDIVRIDVQGGPHFPLVRRSFVFEEPAFVIHEVPPITWTVRFGVGLSVW